MSTTARNNTTSAFLLGRWHDSSSSTTQVLSAPAPLAPPVDALGLPPTTSSPTVLDTTALNTTALNTTALDTTALDTIGRNTEARPFATTSFTVPNRTTGTVVVGRGSSRQQTSPFQPIRPTRSCEPLTAMRIAS